MMAKYPLQLESDEFGERWRIAGDQIIRAVHSVEVCSGRCALHHPSDHHMRDWKLIWRTDRHILERICPHGVGHPDPDDQFVGLPDPESQGIHGCDGCCHREPEKPKYPEHEKLAKVRDRSQAIGEFLEWCNEQGWHLAEWVADKWDDRMFPIHLSISEVLARYFDIDQGRLEEEKRALLQGLRDST